MAQRSPKRPSSFFDKGHLPLWAVLGVSTLLRIILLLQWNSTPYADGIWSDASIYLQWARSIVTSGDWIGTQPFLMTPLYPYLLAVVMSVTGEDLFVIRILQHAAGLAAIVFLYRSADLLWNRRAAFFTALIAGVYGPLLFFPNLLLVETVKILFLTGALFAVLKARSTSSLRWWGVAGLFLGGAILCRPTDALVLSGVVIWIFTFSGIGGPRWKPAVIVTAAAILVILPVTIRNIVVTHEPTLITTNAGLNFYLGNNPKAVGIYYNVDGLDLANDPDGRIYLETSTGRSFTPSEASSMWMQRSREYIATEPVSFAGLMARKALLFFHASEIGQLGYNYQFIGTRYVPVLRFLPPFLFLFPLALAGAVLLRRRWKDDSLVTLFFAAEFLSVILFFVTDRYRLSAIPFMLLFAGAGIDTAWNLWSTGKKKELSVAGIAALAAFLLATVVNVPLAQDDAMEHEYLGMYHMDRKQYEPAIREFRSAVAVKETFSAHNNLGNVLAAIGNIPAAMREYQRAMEINPKQAISAFSMGTAWVRTQQFDSAVVCFTRAKRINPYFAPAYLNGGLAFWFLGKYGEAEKELTRYLELERDQSKTVSVRQDLARLRQIIADEGKK